MASIARASAGASISTGAALAGLAGVVMYVVTGPSSWLAFGVLTVAVALAAAAIDPNAAGRGVTVADGDAGSTALPPIPLLLAAGLTTIATALAVDDRADQGASNADLMAPWLASIALLLLAAWWCPLVASVRRATVHGLERRRPGRLTIATWTGMLAIAVLPRLVRLDRFTTVLDGDEGSFIVQARRAQDGELADLFGPGFLGNPNLYPVAAGWIADVIGSPPYDHRILSGLVGALGVLALWRLGRYLVGEVAAVAGAIVLATMPFHLQFSRSVLNNIADPTALTVALLFVVRAVRFGRGGDAAVSGVALGLGLYGYFGARAFPPILVVVLAALAWAHRLRARDALRLAAWLSAGFVVAALPLLLLFRRAPGEFSARARSLSPITTERLRDDPAATLATFLEALRDGLLYPLIGNNAGFYRHPPPFLGWPVAILLTIGVAIWIARAARGRDPGPVIVLVLPWVVITAGVALLPPIQSQRLIALTPLFALAAGTGLVALATWLGSLAPARRLASGPAILAVALAVIGATELRWYASEDRQVVTYGDYRTSMMWDIGWRVAQAPAGETPPRVLFAGPPFVFTGGFNNLVVQAPELAMTDVAQPLGTMPLPVLADGAMLVIIGERQAERCVAEDRYPSATVAEVHARDGTLLYVAFFREPLAGWSWDATPAGTSFSVVAASPCDG